MTKTKMRAGVAGAAILVTAGSLAAACGESSPEPGCRERGTCGDGGAGGGGNNNGGMGGTTPEIEDPYSLGDHDGVLPDTLKGFPPECESLVDLSALDFEPFQKDGHLYYFELTREAAIVGDEQSCREKDPPAGVTCPNSAKNLRIRPSGSTTCSDTGQIELDLRGGDAFRKWLDIPTLRVDLGEFSTLSLPSGDSQLRFQSGQQGATVLREDIALRIYREVGYPAPASVFVRTQTNIWDTVFGSGTFTAHLMIQAYKKHFFDENLAQATDVWEGNGDPFAADLVEDGFRGEECEWAQDGNCDKAALQSIADQVRAAKPGNNFLSDTEQLVDWNQLADFICLSAFTGAGDDWIHGQNNVVLSLSEGKVIYLPRGLDQSGGFSERYGAEVSLFGDTYLTAACSKDPACRKLVVDSCDDLLTKLETKASDLVQERCEALDAAGLSRAADETACEEMTSYYSEAPTRLRSLLEEYR